MKVDLDGLARNIKSCIDPKKDTGGWAYMVDEMVAHIKRLESSEGAGDTAISQLEQGIEALEGDLRVVAAWVYAERDNDNLYLGDGSKIDEILSRYRD